MQIYLAAAASFERHENQIRFIIKSRLLSYHRIMNKEKYPGTDVVFEVIGKEKRGVNHESLLSILPG
jgi:hypothetical protein